MFRVHYTNHDYFAQDTFEWLDDALDYGRSKGFDFTVWDDKGRRRASFTVLGGLRIY